MVYGGLFAFDQNILEQYFLPKNLDNFQKGWKTQSPLQK